MIQPKTKSSVENYSVSPRDFRFAERSPGQRLRVLSEDDLKLWKERGYLIVPQAVPAENLRAVIDLIWEFQGMDPEDPETWYRNPANEMEMTELVNSGMVEVYNHQSLWNNRQHPNVYDAFVDIWGTEELWVSIDRANLSVPVRAEQEFKGFIHWDVDTSLNPLPVNLQAILSLTDATEETGGFQCVPGIFARLQDWLREQPEDRDPWKPDTTGYEVEQLMIKAGDLVIWNSLLPHGICPNHSRDGVRMAQYLTMSPAQEEDRELVEWRIRSWKDRVAPSGLAFPGDPRNWEQERYETAKLTPLGERLLGLTSWRES